MVRGSTVFRYGSIAKDVTVFGMQQMWMKLRDT
jgi:hypothetical protein